MQVRLTKLQATDFEAVAKMITEFFNYHRRLVNARREFWQTDEQSRAVLQDWLERGEVYTIHCDDSLAGFVYLRFGGQRAAWLEDIYVSKEFRGQGVGKAALAQLDKLAEERGLLAMFVDVIPRNTAAIEFYIKNGFDHLNMIQLRKNYDKTMNKDEEIEVLGFKLKKY